MSDEKAHMTAYRFAFNATAVGRTPDEAFEELLRALKEDPREAIHEEVSYAPYDYFYIDSEKPPES
tara:strand:+ start:1460 stop:1657 length:198 start_codon:yes stop_codon:yes gene_type:complete